jgi:hypothetical protein
MFWRDGERAEKEGRVFFPSLSDISCFFFFFFLRGVFSKAAAARLVGEGSSQQYKLKKKKPGRRGRINYFVQLSPPPPPPARPCRNFYPAAELPFMMGALLFLALFCMYVHTYVRVVGVLPCALTLSKRGLGYSENCY